MTEELLERGGTPPKPPVLPRHGLWLPPIEEEVAGRTLDLRPLTPDPVLAGRTLDPRRLTLDPRPLTLDPVLGGR